MGNPLEVEPAELSKLDVLSLNTGLSGRQQFTGVDQRFERILDFIYRTHPDVVLLQEVYEPDLEKYRNALGGKMFFSRHCNLSMTDRPEDAISFGVAIGSRVGLSNIQEHYYDSEPIDPDSVVLNNGADNSHSLLTASVGIGSQRFNLGTTHFTWHKSTVPSEGQLADFQVLEERLSMIYQELILTGDFNTKRGGHIFDSLARRYHDNIPADVIRTHDTTVRLEAVRWDGVVDGFFTSEHYQVDNLRMVSGLSDHLGIAAEVRRVAV